MAVKLPDIVSRVQINTSGLDQAKQSAVDFGDTAKSKFAGVKKAALAAGAAFAAMKLKGMFSDAIQGASDLQESTGKIDVVFGEAAEQVHKFAQNAARAMGMSKQQALEAAGTYGNLLTSIGVTSDTAADMSTSFVQLAADLASFNNASPEETLNALRAALTGEFEPMKRFGAALNAAAIKAKAMELGLGGASGELDAAAKAQAAYALILEQTTNAQGNFGDTAGDLANQQRTLTAQMTNLKTAIGTALLPVMNALTTLANALASAFQGLPGPIQGIIGGLGGLAVTVGVAGAAFRTLGLTTLFAADGFIRTKGAALFAEGSILRTTAATVAHKVAAIASAAASKAWAAAQWALNAALTANPIGLVIAAIAGLVAAIVVLWKKSETFREAWRAVWDGIEKVFYGVVNGVMAGIETLVNWVIGQLNKLIRAYNAIPLVSDIGELGAVEMRRFGDQGGGGGNTVNQTINVYNPESRTAEDSIQRELRKNAILGIA